MLGFDTSHWSLQAWLEKHDSYEAIVDGANVGLYQQNFADGGFSISQVVWLSYRVPLTLLSEQVIKVFLLLHDCFCS